MARARRLLDGLSTVPEHGWLRVWEGDLLLKVGGEPRRVRELAAEAADIGRRLGDVDLEMTALALEGVALVMDGALPEGMLRLDEATTAAVSGGMSDPVAIGISCCYLVDACERIRDFDRAAQWCTRVKDIAARTRFNALLGICRAQYASVLVRRGPSGSSAHRDPQCRARGSCAWPICGGCRDVSPRRAQSSMGSSAIRRPS